MRANNRSSHAYTGIRKGYAARCSLPECGGARPDALIVKHALPAHLRAHQKKERRWRREEEKGKKRRRGEEKNKRRREEEEKGENRRRKEGERRKEKRHEGKKGRKAKGRGRQDNDNNKHLFFPLAASALVAAVVTAVAPALIRLAEATIDVPGTPGVLELRMARSEGITPSREEWRRGGDGGRG